ncbi:acid protease [Sparassis latifolia]
MVPLCFAVFVYVLAFFNVSFATVLSERRSFARELPVRQYLESVETGMNATGEAAIVTVSISEDKQSFYTLVSAGNMTFRLALDTGSSDLWVISSACSSSACTSVPRYQLAYQSSTFVPVNSNSTAFNVSYEDGSIASGFIARETLHLSNVTVASQAFGLVTSSNVSLTDDISGILGLGFSRLSTIYNTVANGSMAQQGLLDYPVFGLSLPRNKSVGSLTFGAIDGTVVQNRSLIEWEEVVPFAPFANTTENTTSYLQWAVVLSGLSVNGTELTPLPTYPNATSNTSIALIDVGTPGIYGPYQDVSRLFSLIDGSRLVADGQWVIPCDANDTMAFNFGGQNFTMQPIDYLIGAVSGDPGLCLSWPMALPPSADGIDWQLGGAFLKTVYSIFSYGIDTKEPPLIGFYPLNNASSPVQSPEVVESYLSSASATVATTLPNYVLALPSYTTPPYAFNTSFTAPPGLVVSSGLAASTYSAALGSASPNATAIPTVTPSPTLVTLFITGTAGQVSTSVSTASVPSVTLGEPPGWSNAASTVRIPTGLVLSGFCALLVSLLARP